MRNVAILALALKMSVIFASVALTESPKEWGNHPKTVGLIVSPAGTKSCGYILDDVNAAIEDLCYGDRDLTENKLEREQLELISQCTAAALNRRADWALNIPGCYITLQRCCVDLCPTASVDEINETDCISFLTKYNKDCDISSEDSGWFGHRDPEMCTSAAENGYINPRPRPPSIKITKARMVGQSVLGVDAKVGFPRNDPAEGPRYVRLKATINGRSVEENIEVTDLVRPGETKLIVWVYTDTKKLEIKLDNTQDEEGNDVEVPRFSENGRFTLEAVAWSPACGQSKVANHPVNILPDS